MFQVTKNKFLDAIASHEPDRTIVTLMKDFFKTI